MGSPLEILTSLTSEYEVQAVYTNHDYEPYAKQRDAAMAELLSSKGIAFNTCKDQCVFEKK
jgi:deoxyribodipyrimidine photo-lyase